MVAPLTHCLTAIAFTALLATIVPRQSEAQSRSIEVAMASPVNPAQRAIPDTLTLRAAIDLALRSHPDLRVADASLAVARADSSFARARIFNPEVEIQSARGGRTLGSNSEATLDLGVTQEFEFWGKRAARQSVATARSRTSAAEWWAMAQQIESDVRTRFERALFLQDRVAVMDELAELDRRVVLATQARVRDGSMTPLTGRLTELDLLRLEAQGRRVRADLRQARLALALAIGSELPESAGLRGDIQADSLQASEDSVVAVALRVRVEGEVFSRQLAARRAEFQLAERESRPNFTLGAGLTRDRRALSGEDFTGNPAVVGGIAGAKSTDHLWTARISAPIPLWQKNQAGRARASAEITRSQAEYERYRLQTRLQVVGAVRRFQDATGLFRLYLERSTRVRQDLVLIREAYADGRISLDSYLTQKGRLVDTLLGQLEAGDAYWDARGQLEAVAGIDLGRLNGVGTR
jgi:outer membrane protein, heavy metal efflux system